MNLEEQTAEQARYDRRAGEADRSANCSEPQSLSQNQTTHVGCRCAERDADADLRVPLSHGRGHHREKTHRGQQHRRSAEDADQKGIEARPCDAVASRLRISACSSLLACSMVAPGRSLAIRSTSLRAPSRNAGFVTVDAEAAVVIQASTPRGIAKSGGATPTIVNGC